MTKRWRRVSRLVMCVCFGAAWVLSACNGGDVIYDNSEENENEEEIPEATNVQSHVTRVLEYRPAPGQFVNVLPAYEEGDTQETMNAKVLDVIGRYGKGGVISLGGYGGYVVVGFDRPIENRKGEYDFRIYGNAFEGNSEPGIVMVAYDQNGNGQPDEDEWYELAGSDYAKASTVKNYSITYTRTGEPRKILWKDNRGEEGEVEHNEYHTQSYFPQWITGESMTFAGTKLEENARLDSEGIWVLNALDWGYADNAPNDDEEGISFKIDWAVDKDGQSVDLPEVHFVKVYTGVHQYCGAIGETSTEISGVYNIH